MFIDSQNLRMRALETYAPPAKRVLRPEASYFLLFAHFFVDRYFLNPPTRKKKHAD